MFGILLLIIPMATAFTIDDTTISSSGLNTSFNITEPWIGEQIVIGPDSIYVQNLNSSNPLEVSNEKITINLTIPNGAFLGTDFPYFNLSNTTEKRILSNLGQDVNATLIIDTLPCVLISNVSFESQTGANDKEFALNEFLCFGSEMTIDIEGLEQATTVPTNRLILEELEFPFDCQDGDLGLTIAHSDTDFPGAQGDTPVNNTLPTTINIVLDYIIKGADSVDYEVVYSNGISDSYTSNELTTLGDEIVINRAAFDVPFDDKYDVIVTASNEALNQSCSASYEFGTQRGGTTSTRRTGMLIIGAALLIIVVLISLGVLLL